MFANLKLYLIVFASLVVVGLVGYHFIEVAQLNTKINTLTIDNKTLSDNQAVLMKDNESNVQAINQLELDLLNQSLELEKINQADKNGRDQLSNLQAKIDSSQYQTRLTDAQKRDPKLLLDIINKDYACAALHLKDNGKCVMGQWHPDNSH